MRPLVNVSADLLRSCIERTYADGADERVRERLRWLLHFVENGMSISGTCRHFGIARTTFYRCAERFDPANLKTLADRSHRPRMPRISQIHPMAHVLVQNYRRAFPALGRTRIARLLREEHGIALSASGVGRILRSPAPSAVIAPIVTSDVPFMPKAVHRFGHSSWTLVARAALVASVLCNVSLLMLFLITLSVEGRVANIHADAAENLVAGSGTTFRVTRISERGEATLTASTVRVLLPDDPQP